MSKVTRVAVFLLGVSAFAGLTSVAGYKYGRCKLRRQLAAQATAPVPAPPVQAEPPPAPSSAPAPKPIAKPAAAPPAPAPKPAVAAAPARPAAPAKKDLALYLPRAIYATVGIEQSVYFENLVDCDDVNRLRFRVKCPLGTGERRRWKFTPTEAQAGTHPFEVEVTDSKGVVLGKAASSLKVAPADAGAGKALRMLIVGDSVTNFTYYPEEIVRLAARPGNPRLQLIGTNSREGLVGPSHKPAVVHEGYGGWTWHCFLNHFEPGSAKARHRDNSPFLYKEDGKVKLDVERYLRETSPQGPPDLVTFQMGINDVYCQPLPYIVSCAQKLVGEFRKAAPRASLAIWLTQPVNYSEETFRFLYLGNAPRSVIKTRQHALAQALEKAFAGREAEGIFVMPLNVSLDPIDGYAVDDAVHPTIDGYHHLGQTVYAWMKWWLANEDWGKRLGAE